MVPGRRRRRRGGGRPPLQPGVAGEEGVGELDQRAAHGGVASGRGAERGAASASGLSCGVFQNLATPTPIQRKKSLPDVQGLPKATDPMSREEVSVLSSARREEVRRLHEETERLRANPLLYLVSPHVKASVHVINVLSQSVTFRSTFLRVHRTGSPGSNSSCWCSSSTSLWPSCSSSCSRSPAEELLRQFLVAVAGFLYVVSRSDGETSGPAVAFPTPPPPLTYPCLIETTPALEHQPGRYRDQTWAGGCRGSAR